MKIESDIIISPSGQLYGSENVLFDYLEGSTKAYKIYVPKDSLFFNKLKDSGYTVSGFKSLKLLYVKVFIQLLFLKRSVMVNEAGHINYVKIIAKLLPKSKWVVVVRLLEDCNAKFNNLNSNITVVSISSFIQRKLDSYSDSVLIYDPYTLSEGKNKTLPKEDNDDFLNIGIIGRVTSSKGGDLLLELMDELDKLELLSLFKFRFFGHYNVKDTWFAMFESALKKKSVNYHLHGFVQEKNILYQQIDLLLQLNEREPLGRIIFEAVDFNKAFLCLKAGGSGELATILGLEDYAATDVINIAQKLKEFVKSKKDFNQVDLENAQKLIKSNFKASAYAESLERFL